MALLSRVGSCRSTASFASNSSNRRAEAIKYRAAVKRSLRSSMFSRIGPAICVTLGENRGTEKLNSFLIICNRVSLLINGVAFIRILESRKKLMCDLEIGSIRSIMDDSGENLSCITGDLKTESSLYYTIK